MFKDETACIRFYTNLHSDKTKVKVDVLHPVQQPGHIETGPQHCHWWQSKPQRGDSL